MVIIGQVSGKQSFENKFEIPFPEEELFRAKYYLDQGERAWIISSHQPRIFSKFHYGMVPFWSRKPVYHFESPVEGSINPAAGPVKKRIIVHPSFRRPIRENRCLIPADYFITLNEMGEPLLVFSSVTRTFALAGIYDNWKEDYYQKEFYQGFSLLTISAPEDFQRQGLMRLPLILPEKEYKHWLNPEAALAEITSLMENSPEGELNAYPVKKKYVTEKLNSRELCQPSGEMIRQKAQDTGKMAALLRSFRFMRGATHQPASREERIWRENPE